MTGRSALVVVACLVLARPAAASEPASDQAAAEAAFVAGRALMKEGRYEEACPKLETSQRLDPGLGTLLNLAECLERTGRTASAWLRYREAAGIALRSGQREREVIARERVTALEPSLCHLVVRVPEERKSAIVLRRDGVAVDASAWDLPVPVDPGKHVVEEVSRSGTHRFDVEVVPPAATTCPDTVLELPRRSEPAAASPAPEHRPARTETPRTWTPGRTIAAALGAGGVLALGAGTVFGVKAAGTNDDADRACTDLGCTAAGRDLLHEAGTQADVSTVSFVVGSALVAGAIALWFVAAPAR